LPRVRVRNGERQEADERHQQHRQGPQHPSLHAFKSKIISF
jgi:hypothetical protein